MKVTLETDYGTYSVEKKTEQCSNLLDMMIALMHAAEFHPEIIRTVIQEKSEEYDYRKNFSNTRHSGHT